MYIIIQNSQIKVLQFVSELQDLYVRYYKEPVFEEGNADWLSRLPSVIQQNNNTIHSSIKMTPYEASKKNEGKRSPLISPKQ